MKLMIGVLFLVGLFQMGCTGLSRNRNSARSELSILGTLDDAKVRLAEYRHVLLVRVEEDSTEPSGPVASWRHFTGVVVKVYKGDWKRLEKISFKEFLDFPADAAINNSVGECIFVFSNFHTNVEFGIWTGDRIGFDAELEAQIVTALATKEPLVDQRKLFVGIKNGMHRSKVEKLLGKPVLEGQDRTYYGKAPLIERWRSPFAPGAIGIVYSDEGKVVSTEWYGQ